MVRVDNKSAFGALLIVADEAGRVATFCFTRTKSLQEGKHHLEELANRGGQIEVIHTGKNNSQMNNLIILKTKH